MAERIRRVLQLAVAKAHNTIVLGAWGCGVFRKGTLKHITTTQSFPRCVVLVLDAALPFQCHALRSRNPCGLWVAVVLFDVVDDSLRIVSEILREFKLSTLDNEVSTPRIASPGLGFRFRHLEISMSHPEVG